MSKGPNSTNNSAEELLISYYQLANLDNYKTLFVSPVSHVTRIYVAIIFEYMKLMNQKISSKAPKSNYSFIFGKGLSAISHVFCMLYISTKNIDITCYHSQKAVYFYIEFIEQISYDENTFLNLSSKDAVMFVYKKTIYEMNHQAGANAKPLKENDHSHLKLVNEQIHLYKSIVDYAINEGNVLKNEKESILIEECCERLVGLHGRINNENILMSIDQQVEFVISIYTLVGMLKTREGISICLFFNLICDTVEIVLDIKKENLTNTFALLQKICSDEFMEHVHGKQDEQELTTSHDNHDNHNKRLADWLLAVA